MRYADDVARLARAVAALTAAGPPTGILHGAERQAVLVSRDALATELRDLTRVVLGIAPQPSRLDLELITVNPARALHAALANLHTVAGNGTPLTNALAVGGGPLTSSWQRAARGAVALEQYHDVLITIAGEDARAVVRDISEVAAALPYLDADLAAALPVDDPARDQLLEPTWHGLVRLAAIEVQAQTADLPPDATHVQLPERPRVLPVRTVADLPPATWQLTQLIAARGAELTAVEARAVARVLAAGVELTARVLADPASTAPGSAVTRHLSAAVPHLQQVAGRPLATLTPPSPAVLFLAQQLRERLTAVSGLVDHLQHERRPSAPRADLARIARPLSRWAAEAVATATQLAACLRTADTTGRLLAPREDTARGRHQNYLWLPTTRGIAGPHPVVLAAGAAAADLTAANKPLAEISGILTGVEQARAATRRAALHATAAFAELRSAVAARAAQRLPHPSRAAHPANLPSTLTQRRRPRR